MKESQTDLFPSEGLPIFVPASRRDDPETSKLAEKQINRSGVRGRQQVLAMNAVHAHPGLTSRELALAARIEYDALHKRLPECEKAGVIRRGHAHACSVSGKLAVTWFPVKTGTVISSSSSEAGS
jgi:hypothetical protein